MTLARPGFGPLARSPRQQWTRLLNVAGCWDVSTVGRILTHVEDGGSVCVSACSLGERPRGWPALDSIALARPADGLLGLLVVCQVVALGLSVAVWAEAHER